MSTGSGQRMRERDGAFAEELPPGALPKTAAGRLEHVMWLLNPTDEDGEPLVDDDGKPVRLITREQAMRLLDFPSLEDFDRG